MEIDWNDGSPVQTLQLVNNGVKKEQGDQVSLKHMFPENMAVGSHVVKLTATNEWGKGETFEYAINVVKAPENWTFSYSSLLNGLPVPSKDTLSDGNQVDTVFATELSPIDPNPQFIVDFGEVIVPGWLVFSRVNAIPGTDYDGVYGRDSRYFMRGRRMSTGIDDENNEIKWTTRSMFSTVESPSMTYNKTFTFLITTPCRYIRFDFENKNIGNDLGIGIGDIYFTKTRPTNTA